MHSPGGVGCARAAEESKTMATLVEADNDRTIDIPVGEIVQVTLPENATTGYRWAIESYNSDVIEALGSEPHYTAKGVGSGGDVAFTFRGKKAGTGEIILKQWRQWEGDSSVIARFRVRLNVRLG
jgi:inhibitor of cysteine peptidase